MKNVVLAVVLHGSILAAFVLFLLWHAGKFDKSDTLSDQLPVAAHTSGVLPVVPVVAVYDPVRETLREDLRAGRAVCAGGYFARPPTTPGGYPYAVQIEVDGNKVSCP